MTTSDGISAEDWDIVHQLAVDIVNSTEEESDRCRARLFEYLDKLVEKYGELPSILATRADFLPRSEVERQEDLLKRSYALASALHDARNKLYAAHSLAALYIDELRNSDEGTRWLDRLRQELNQGDDGTFSEDYTRLFDELARLRS